MSSTSSRFTCEICGISFNRKEERDEHAKLEHKEHKAPTGVG